MRGTSIGGLLFGFRLVEGTELLAHLLHPDRVDAPAGVAFQEVATSLPRRVGRT